MSAAAANEDSSYVESKGVKETRKLLYQISAAISTLLDGFLALVAASPSKFMMTPSPNPNNSSSCLLQVSKRRGWPGRHVHTFIKWFDSLCPISQTISK